MEHLREKGGMTLKKRAAKECIWFICTLAGGIILCLFLYGILGVDVNCVLVVVGVIVTLLAVYVVRLTVWVLKQSI